MAERKRELRPTMDAVCGVVKSLDVRIGDVIEIEARHYEVVPRTNGGVALKPAITRTVAEIEVEHGLRPLAEDEFEEHFGDLPSDGEDLNVNGPRRRDSCR